MLHGDTDLWPELALDNVPKMLQGVNRGWQNAVADRNLNPHKGIHTPHTRYDFVPDAIHGVVGMMVRPAVSSTFGVT
jgi:hypothetical protein